MMPAVCNVKAISERLPLLHPSDEWARMRRCVIVALSAQTATYAGIDSRHLCRHRIGRHYLSHAVAEQPLGTLVSAQRGWGAASIGAHACARRGSLAAAAPALADALTLRRCEPHFRSRCWTWRR
jgi:hypothetical protein